MTEPTFSIRQIDGNWHLIVTANGREQAYPAGTELHAKVMMGLAKEPYDRAKAGLPPVVRR